VRAPGDGVVISEWTLPIRSQDGVPPPHSLPLGGRSAAARVRRPVIKKTQAWNRNSKCM